jgi:hypothetical protein
MIVVYVIFFMLSLIPLCKSLSFLIENICEKIGDIE